MATNAVSGLAASVRNASESETFDLAGQNSNTIERFVRDAFNQPLPLSEMIRLTFITGAGKLGRQKYDENAAKAMTSTLRELDYEEDRAASAVLECAGTFKMQHDTGKNLKTVVVFPKVTGVDLAGLSLNENESKQGPALLPEESAEHKIAFTSMNIFKRMIESRCPSWSQKKGCVGAIDSLKKMVEELDDKLLHGTPLNDSEQDFYDGVSLSSLEDKQACVRDLMHAQVEGGNITADERRTLLEQVQKRLATLAKELETARSKGAPAKRIQNLEGNQTKAQGRKEMLEKISPKKSHPLKNEAEILKLRREAAPLYAIEDAAKGRLLTLKESQSVARKDEIEEEIKVLEDASRGWFETDDFFASRVDASRAAWKNSKQAKKKTAPKASASSALPSSAGWATTAPRKKATPVKTATTRSKQPRGGNLFAAMMEDSDSD